jgi:hypothetical protein
MGLKKLAQWGTLITALTLNSCGNNNGSPNPNPFSKPQIFLDTELIGMNASPRQDELIAVLRIHNDVRGQTAYFRKLILKITWYKKHGDIPQGYYNIRTELDSPRIMGGREERESSNTSDTVTDRVTFVVPEILYAGKYHTEWPIDDRSHILALIKANSENYRGPIQITIEPGMNEGVIGAITAPEISNEQSEAFITGGEVTIVNVNTMP